MIRISYHCSHEQFAPSVLLRLAKMAANNGFTGIHCSDHFSPWVRNQGQSGHSFSWLGAAMQVIDLPFSTVCTAGYRQHPAVIAQAVATLCELYTGRFSLALGSGEAINEAITGEPWPDKASRNDRLQECFSIISSLLSGQEVTCSGQVRVKHARLFTLPSERPKIFGAALTAETAGWLAGWAEGLLTANQPIPQLSDIVYNFRQGGGLRKPMTIKVQLSYAETQQVAETEAMEQWGANIFPSAVLSDLSTVHQFESLANRANSQELRKQVLVSSNCSDFVGWLQEYIDLGFDELILHNVNKDQELFIKAFGRYVLPVLQANNR